jgi:hypothetical protein
MTTILAGAQVSPSGDPGSQGSPAFSTTVAVFTVPGVGANLDVPVVDASWISIGQFIFIANAGGPALAGAFLVTAIAGNVVTVQTPASSGSGSATPGISVPARSTVSPGGSQGIQGTIGPTGPQGNTGVQGPQGIIGPQGPTGPPGNTGPQGISGVAATADAGTTTTGAPGTNASVINAGSTNAAVFNFTIPAGVQGVQGPQGNTGSQGSNAFTATTNSFIVPPVGQTTTVTVLDASWLVPGQMVYVDTAGGASAGALQITAIVGNTVTLLNPAVISAIPPASTTTSGLLNQISGNTTDFIDGTNSSQPLAPVIWYARMRSFNAVGNPTFEVDQRNAGASVTAGAVIWAMDRWQFAKNAGTTMAATGVQVAGPVNLPGTNFAISSKFYRVTLTATQASLAAADIIWLTQTVEGVKLRELVSDVHSVQLLVRTSVAGLKFCLSLRDTSNGALTKICTIPSANTWTLITLPALPVWLVGTLAPGVTGYQLSIGLAVGSTYTSPANDVWTTGNFVGGPGQSNFAASPVNSTFDLAFVQHEPGSLCTTPIDCPFTANLDDCLRYYTKSYPYGSIAGATGFQGSIGNFIGTSATAANGGVQFPKRMAKAPTVTVYNPSSGAVNSAYIGTSGAALAISAIPYIADSGFLQLQAASGMAAGASYIIQYIADTAF